MDKIKVAKELVKLAKSLVADIEVDQTQHRLQELNEWIKVQFRQKAVINLNKLSCKAAINNLEQKKFQQSFYGVDISDNINDDIVFRKTFAMRYDGKMPYDVKIDEKNLFTYVCPKFRSGNDEIAVYFRLTLKAEDWYPLFRSCKELTYDDKGKFDKESFNKLKKSLEKCFEELKI